MTDTNRLADLARNFTHAVTIVAGVSPDQLGDPTPCPDYDVAALIDHLIGASWLGVALSRGESPAGGEFPHVELADAPDQLRRAGQAAEAAWSDDARLAATVTMPWGQIWTGATLLELHVTELAAHTWDLAVATGQLDRLDPGWLRALSKPPGRCSSPSTATAQVIPTAPRSKRHPTLPTGSDLRCSWAVSLANSED